MILFKQWYAARNLPGTAGLNVRHLQYIATRPGAVPNHGRAFGLWGRLPGQEEAENQKSLKDAKAAIREASGQHTIYRAVLSANQEDAENYGLYHREKWEELLQKNLDTIRKEMGIKPENFFWTASFHCEVGHPHVHLLYWDNGPGPQKEGLSEEKMDIMSEHVRAAFGRDVYREDLQLLQGQQRELTKEMRQQIQAMCREANPEKSLDMKKLFKRPELESLGHDLLKICQAVPKSGSLKYGYLPPAVKAQVDRLTDRCLREIPELSQTLETYKSATVQISELYGNGEEAQAHNLDKALGKLRKELGNEVMGAVRAVLEALPPESLDRPERVEQQGQEKELLPEPTPEPPEKAPNEEVPEHGPDTSSPEPEADTWGGRPKWLKQEAGSRGKDTWWTAQYNAARKLLFAVDEEEQDFEQARELLSAEAKTGNGFAMYDLGKMFLTGQGVEPDEEAAQTWFRQAYEAIGQRERTASKEWDRVYCQYRLGKLYSFGHGVDQDYSQAAAWWEKAVAGKNASAAYALGGLYHRGQGVEQDSGRAFDLFSMAATDERNPNAYAAYTLGQMYHDGDGTEVDQEASKDWFRQAYNGFRGYVKKSPDDKLFYRLGRMNLDGIGTEINREQAKTYFEAAVRLKNNDARYGLARLYLATDAAWYAPEKAQKLLEDAVQEGHTMSQYLLGKLLYQGTEIPQDIPRAAALLEKAATNEEAPNAYAAYILGQIYRDGEGIAADEGAAQRWFQLAYRLLQEDVEKTPSGFAYYRLGAMALEGLGTEASPGQAMDYFEKAAELGSNDARYSLAKLLLEPDSSNYNPGRAENFLTAAADEGHTSAQYLLGKFLVQGELLPLDLEKGICYLQQAAEAGNHYAEYQLGKVYFFGKDGALERDKDKGLKYLRQAAEHGNEPAKELLENISKMATANMLRGMMLLGSQLAHQHSAQAQAGQRNRSRDMSREAKKDRQAQQSQAGSWEQE